MRNPSRLVLTVATSLCVVALGHDAIAQLQLAAQQGYVEIVDGVGKPPDVVVTARALPGEATVLPPSK